MQIADRTAPEGYKELPESTIALEQAASEPITPYLRILVGAQAIGTAQSALDRAADHCAPRHRSADDIPSFDDARFTLADMALRLEAARRLVYAAAERSQQHDPDLPDIAAAAQRFAEETVTAIAADAARILRTTDDDVPATHDSGRAQEPSRVARVVDDRCFPQLR